MMVKSHDKYGESEMTIKSAESLVERIKECIDFVRKWSTIKKILLDCIVLLMVMRRKWKKFCKFHNFSEVKNILFSAVFQELSDVFSYFMSQC